MRVNYSGMSKDNITRVAFIALDKDNKEEINMFKEMINQMDMKGWNIQYDFEDCAICQVLDFDEYKDFMKDWKQCKKDLLAPKRRGMFK